MQKLKLITVTMLTICGFFFLSAQSLKAATSENISNFDIKVRVNEDLSANVAMQLDFKNTDSKNVLSGKSFSMPFPEIKSLSSKLNNIPISVTTNKDKSTGLTVFNLDFGDNVIINGRSGKLELNFQIPKAVKDINGIKSFTFYNNNAFSNKGNLTISYPSQFGNISFITENDFKTSTRQDNIELSLPNKTAIQIQWGESYYMDLKTKFTILDTNNDLFLLNLVKNAAGQEVSYGTFENLSYGSYDKYGNLFALTYLDAVKTVGYEFRVKKENTKLEETGFKDYGIEIDKNSFYGKEFETLKSQNKTDKETLKEFNDFLLSNSTLNLTKKVNPNEINTIWQRNVKDSPLTPFEYCHFLIGAANNLGQMGQIKYGYLINMESDLMKPHMWCEFKIDSEIFIIDTYLQKETGLNFFGIKSDFDRITVGSWYPDLEYINALGLIDPNIKFYQYAFRSGENIYPKVEEGASMGLIMPDIIKAGHNFDITLQLKNNTNRFLPIKDLLINGNSKLNFIKLSDELLPALLPNYEGNINLGGVSNRNFLDYGKRSMEVEVFLDDNFIERLEANAIYNVRIDPYILLIFALIVIILLSIILAIIKHLIFRKVKKVDNNREETSRNTPSGATKTSVRKGRVYID